MEILKCKPAVKDYIWGGAKLSADWGKDARGLARVAETWEVSCHPDGLTEIDGGTYDGLTLDAFIKEHPSEMGAIAAKCSQFPILIKLIDAKESLSIQVHPDDAYAMAHEGQFGKTEVWYVLQADEGAGVIWGFEREISKEEFAARIQDNTLMEAIHFEPVKAGDVIFVESGTLHGIGRGITIAEIQQNSNVTYRVYDYGRIGADGKPRALHIDQALDVTKRAPVSIRKSSRQEGVSRRTIADCQYFTVTETVFRGGYANMTDADSFHALTIVSGTGKLKWDGGAIQYNKGDTFFVPASVGRYGFESAAETVLLRTELCAD